jgi:hypothetical protein
MDSASPCFSEHGKCITYSLFGIKDTQQQKGAFNAATQDIENMIIGDSLNYPRGWSDFASKLKDLLRYTQTVWSNYDVLKIQSIQLATEMSNSSRDYMSSQYKTTTNMIATNKKDMKVVKDRIRLLQGWYVDGQTVTSVDDNGGYLNSCYMFWFRVLLLRNEQELEKQVLLEAAKSSYITDNMSFCQEKIRVTILREVFDVHQYKSEEVSMQVHEKIGEFFLDKINLPGLIRSTSSGEVLSTILQTSFKAVNITKIGNMFSSIYLDPVNGCIGFITVYADFLRCQSFPNSVQRSYFQSVLATQVSEALHSYRSCFPVCKFDECTEQINFLMEYDRFFNGTPVSESDGAGIVQRNRYGKLTGKKVEFDISLLDEYEQFYNMKSTLAITRVSEKSRGYINLIKSKNRKLDSLAKEGPSIERTAFLGPYNVYSDSDTDSDDDTNDPLSKTFSWMASEDIVQPISAMTLKKPRTEFEPAWLKNVIFHPLIHPIPTFLDISMEQFNRISPLTWGKDVTDIESGFMEYLIVFFSTALMFYYKPDQILISRYLTTLEMNITFQKDPIPRNITVLNILEIDIKDREDLIVAFMTPNAIPRQTDVLRMFLKKIWEENVFTNPPENVKVIPFPSWWTIDFVSEVRQKFGKLEHDKDNTKMRRSTTEVQPVQFGMVGESAQSIELGENERHIHIQRIFGLNEELSITSVELGKDSVLEMWNTVQPLLHKKMFGDINFLIRNVLHGLI